MALMTKSTAYTRMFLMVLTSDHVSAATGKTVTVTLSKAGGSFGAPSGGGTATEVASGWYKIALSTTDTNTAGDLIIHCTASLCDDTDIQDQVATMDVIGTAISSMAISSVSGAVGSVTAAVSVTGDLTATMKTSVENAVWDAARASHVATGVFGQLGQEILRDNTATAGAASTITLDASASTTVDLYRGDVVYIYSGTGAGQSRVISAYSAGRAATVVPNWVTTPDNTSKFILTAQRSPLVGTDTRIVTSADSITSGETVAAVTGAVGSVTGAVASVAGNVGGNVVGSVASVTARVTANTDQWAGTTIPAPSVTGVPKVDLVDIAGSSVSTAAAQLGVNAVQIGAAVPGSATIGTVTTTTTATNLTNAPTSGDFTATMKTSLNAATPASITGAVGSVTGNVGGNVTGSVGSVVGSTGNPGANPTGSVVADGSNTALTFLTDRTESADDYWKDALLLITSGTMNGQVKKVSAYNGTTKFITVLGGFTAAPATGVTFQLENR